MRSFLRLTAIAVLLHLLPVASQVEAAPVTDPEDPRNWQGATVETFRTLLGYPTRQAVIDAGILDDEVFPLTTHYASTFVRPGLPCGVSPDSVTTPTYVGGIEGCAGSSTDPATFASLCNSVPLADYASGAQCLDLWWVQDLGDGDLTSGHVWDLGGPSNQVAVFPIVDQGPLPQEAMDFTVYLSNDSAATVAGSDGNSQWVQATLERVYLEGWNSAWVADGFATVWQAPDGQTFRYVNVISGGTGALVHGGSSEIDAVLGLTGAGGAVCSSGPDADEDGVCDNVDNCPNVANPLQEDSNQNNVGDACEGCSGTNMAARFIAPTPTCGTIYQVDPGQPVTFTVTGNDPDPGDTVIVSVTGMPAGATLTPALPDSGNPVSTTFNWTPGAADTGQYVLTFRIADRCGLPQTCLFTVRVGDVPAECSPSNQVARFVAPTPACGTIFQVDPGQPVTFAVTANDPDAGDDVRVSVTGVPVGATFTPVLPDSGNPVSSTFSWTPAAGDTGQYVLTFTAADRCGLPQQCSFIVRVGSAAGCSPTNASAAFVAPTPTCGSTIVANVGSPVNFTVRATDADAADSVRVSVVGLPVGVLLTPALPDSGNPAGTDFSWTPTASDTGSHAITFTAADRCGIPVQCTITVRVLDNQPPDCSAAYVVDWEIWPPNGRMVPVRIDGVEDADGDSTTIEIIDISQDEPAGKFDNDSCDGRVDGNGVAHVRARREGGGNGRVYKVTFIARDGNGGECEGSVDLCVPHDQGRHNECVDDGQNHHADIACLNRDDDDDGDDDSRNGNGRDKDEIVLTVRQVGSGVAEVQYTLPEEADMTLSVYNVAGRRVATIAQGHQPAGTGIVQWTAPNPVPTVYFVQLKSGEKSVAKRIFFVNR